MTEEPQDRDLPDGASVRAASGVKRRLFWSFGAQSVAILLRIVQQIVLVPILIKAWGTALYADWITISSAVALLSMLDLGMQIYFGNAMLIAWSRQDITAYRRYLGTAFALYSVVLTAVAATLIATTLLLSWPTFLGTRALSPQSALWTTGLLAISTLSLIPFGVVTAVYRARGDYGRGGVWAIMVEAGRGIGLCVVAVLGGTPVACACLYLVAGLIFWIVVLFDQRRLYGEFSLCIHFPAAHELREAIAGSALYVATGVSAPIILNGPVLLLGALAASSDAVAAFSVSRTFTGFLRQVVNQLCHPIGAELARQQAVGDMPKFGQLLLSAARMVAGSAGLLAGFTVVAAGPFIHIWTAGKITYDPWLIGAFVSTIVLTAPAQVALMLFLYNNKPRVLVATYCAFAAGTLLFCALFIGSYAAAGAAAGAGLAEFLSIGLLLPRAAAAIAITPVVVYLSRSYVVAGLAFCMSYVVAEGLENLIVPRSLGLLSFFGVAWAVATAVPSFFLLLASRERRWAVHQATLRLSRLFGLFRSTRVEL